MTYYFFNDMINMKNLDPNKIKMDKKSYKNMSEEKKQELKEYQ